MLSNTRTPQQAVRSFRRANGQGAKRMSRRTAHDVLKNAFEAAGLNGHLETHSLRKSFAQRFYDRTGDIFTVQEMLGHKAVSTTQKGCVNILAAGCEWRLAVGGRYSKRVGVCQNQDFQGCGTTRQAREPRPYVNVSSI